jgi:histone H3/H4
VREVIYSIDQNIRIEQKALELLQEATEAALVHEFESTYTVITNTDIANNILVTQILAIHGKRVTIQAKDMGLVRQMHYHLLGYRYIGNPKAQ